MSKYTNPYFILALLSIAMITMSVYDASGKMSHDSAYYLRLAKNMINGHGYFVSPALDGDNGEYFAVWPIGYPTLIAVVGYLTGVPLYWSAKITNFLLLCLLFIFLGFAIRDRARLIFVSFLSAPMLIINASTLSELPFIVFIIIGTVSCFKYLMTETRYWLIPIILSGISVFLSRYIGLYFVIWLGVLMIGRIVRADLRTALHIFISISIIFLFCVAYLFVNQSLTGHMTGQTRVPALESHAELAIALVKALALEANLITRHRGVSAVGQLAYIFGFLLSAGVGALLVLALRKDKIDVRKDFVDARLWTLFLSSGIVYLVCIVILRWFYELTPFDSRYLFPFTALVLLSVVSYMDERPKVRRTFRAYWICIMMLSLLLNAVAYPIQSFRVGNYTVLDHFRTIRESYDVLRSGDVLISTNDFVQLVYPNVYWQRPYSRAQFVQMLDSSCAKDGRRVFSDMGDDLAELGEKIKYRQVEGYRYVFSRSKERVLAQIDCQSLHLK